MDDDARLIALLLAGDDAAIAEVRGWVAAAVGRYRARLLGDAEDLEQEALLDLMESLANGRFRAQSRLATYVHSYARFKCIDRLRTLGRRDMVELDDEALHTAAPSPLEELTQRESAELAQRVVAALPAGCRELWEMIADGMSYQAMSAAMGVGEGAIRVRVHRCRQRALAIRLRLLAGEDL
ncbi:MAG TPA: sigma-70 family RNA polymerase sigma factor [Thermoanaerobaculia bacterium]|jgi:RNA polymerase sigma-70 factor (ECF subfamily)|nr:sigma-70 family RNA polymerase sigma factor [Thermoanaerobaculia bacterium]